MAKLKETNEFVKAVFATIAQGVESFKDGAQVTDILAFVDEAELWKKGIDGFASSFKGEALAAQPNDIEDMFNPQYERLVASGIKPMLAYTIVNSFKNIFSVYAVSASSGEPAKS